MMLRCGGIVEHAVKRLEDVTLVRKYCMGRNTYLATSGAHATCCFGNVSRCLPFAEETSRMRADVVCRARRFAPVLEA